MAARTEQLPPKGDWRTWYLRGGRGSGKTRTGGETLADWITPYMFEDEPGDWAIVAPTFADARDTCMEGPSGLIRALGGVRGGLIGSWNRSYGELFLLNGSRVFCDGADDGALRIQGKNLRGCWADEIGLWRQWQTAWNESIAFAVRLDPSLIVATGTPKTGHPLVALLLKDPRVAKTHMRLSDNLANLHPAAVADLERRFAGTRLGRQELEGEFLEDVPGALWTRGMFEEHRVDVAPELSRIVVAVDPAASADPETGSSETGIVVAGFSTHTGRYYVLADRTCMLSPHGWASEAIRAYKEFEADRVVAEKNQGGDMVSHTIRTVAPSAPIKLVHASRGKHTRAEPIAALYEQGKVSHVGVFPELEDQCVSWTPEDPVSPDRMDALVWALTDLVGPASVSVTAYRSDPDDLIVRRGDLVFVGADAERFRDKPGHV